MTDWVSLFHEFRLKGNNIAQHIFYSLLLCIIIEPSPMQVSTIKRLLVVAFVLSLLVPFQAGAFSILAHEAVIDASWEKELKPLLLLKYPNATKDELKIAHAYAYGGCLMPDMGYMPKGNPYFTNLVHYVRSGDFMTELVKDVRDLNELAFALGAVSHYVADEYGHSLATNRTVPTIYPDLRKKFGDVITYADDHTSHSRTEFAYDVVQVAKGHYATDAYHDFIGFSMSERLLDEAFLKTYGQDLNDVFKNYSSAVATFRWGVREVFPHLVSKAWHSNKDSIRILHPEMTRAKFHYHMPKKAFQKEFGKDYERPGFGARFVVWLIRVLPKVGPLKKLSFKSPGQQGEKYFASAMDTILHHYGTILQVVAKGQLQLKDIDFDTGKPTSMGEYALTDDTYADWVIALQKVDFNCISPAMKTNIDGFYNNADTTNFLKEDAAKRQKAMDALGQLNTLAVK